MVMAALLVVLLTASSCAAREFDVGGHDGWTTSPGEPHNHWAERNRFQVNDTLVFRYDKNVDAVLRVSQSHYDACNTSDPWIRLADGETRILLNVSGPFFFISGDYRRCQAGERLIIVVLAVRDSAPSALPPPPPPKPASSASPPVPSPTQLAPPPAPYPASASPSPAPMITAPVPRTKNRTSSSGVALRTGVLTYLLIGGAAVLL